MQVVVSTLLIAFLLILAALCLIGLGWIVTGKSRIRAGGCGINPDQKRNKKCGTEQINCDLCKPKGNRDEIKSK